jgi:hypothetical protein
MARRVPFGAAILSAALFVAACSGSGGAVSAGGQTTGSADTNGSSSSGSSNAGGSSTGSSSSGGGGGGGAGDAGFTYTPWGPNDPPIPEQYAAFATASIQELNCAAVSNVGSDARFWEVATGVCLALKGNHNWPDTRTVPPPPRTENPYLNCLNSELASMLERALRWHAANPGRRPVIHYPRRSSTSPCQSRIYGVRVLPASDPDSSVGKVAVAVTAATGKNNEDFFVTVDGQPSDQNDVNRNSLGDGLQRAVVLLDPPAHDRDAVVVVDNGRGRVTRTIHLTATSSPGSPSDSATPSGAGDTSGSVSPGSSSD